MRLPRFRRRERILAVATLAAATLGIGYVVLLEPLVTSWFDLRHKAEASAVELAKLRGLVGSRDRIGQAHKRVAESVLTVRSEQEAQLLLFNEVSRIAGECGVEVDGLKPVRVAKAGGFDRYGVELSGRCTAPVLLDLLLAMQVPEHLLRIDKLTTVVGRGKPPLTVSMRISKLAHVAGNK
jgi:hypothetical protein